MIFVSPSYFAVRLMSLVFGIFVSLYFGGLYSQGDQLFYNEWYQGFAQRDFLDAYAYLSAQINPFEVFYFIPTWVGASVLDKLYYDAMINVALVLAFVSVLRRFSIHPLMAGAIVLSSYYLPVLMLAAERLKFGFLAIFFLLLVVSRSKRIFWGFATVFGHLQMLIPLIALAVALVVSRARISTVISRYFRKYLGIFILICAVLVHSMSNFSVLLEYAVYKFDSYAKFDILEIFKPSVFFVLSLYCAWSQRRFVSVFFVFIFIASFLVGSERVTIVAYFAFIAFSSFRNHGLNLANFIVMPYMLVKSIFFYGAIFDHGSGF